MALPRLTQYPVIASVRRPQDLERAVAAPVSAVFLLFGDINDLGQVVNRVRGAGKSVYLHLDLVNGLGMDRAAVRYVARQIRPDGIISTRSQLVRAAAEEGLTAIQRLFIIDSMGLNTALDVIQNTRPDAIELLPGVLPAWVFAHIRQKVALPIVAGGLIREPADLALALRNEANAVSVSRPALWSRTTA